MIGLFLLITLSIALWIGCIAFRKLDNDGGAFACGLLGTIATVVLFFATMGVCMVPSDAKIFCEKRARCANLVESINDKMTIETINHIVNDATYINKKILNHREHVDSKFSGVFYSRKVAEQELIDLSGIVVTTNKKIQ